MRKKKPATLKVKFKVDPCWSAVALLSRIQPEVPKGYHFVRLDRKNEIAVLTYEKD